MPVSISLLRRYHLPVAPEGIFLGAWVEDPDIAQATTRDTYDESFHKVLYVWDFGDAGAASDKVVNLAAAHNDLNRGYGKYVAHVFTRPGRYTIRCTAYKEDGIEIGRAEFPVEIADPARAFAGRQTILIDPDGRGDPDHHPEAHIVPDWTTGLEALQALTRPGRLLLKRGSITQLPGLLRIRGGFAAFRLGAWGASPARPVLSPAPGFADPTLIELHESFAGDAVFQGLSFQGLWDSTTESGTDVTMLTPDSRNNAHFLVDDCAFRGFKYGCSGFAGQEAWAEDIYIVHNSDFTDWVDFGVNPGLNTERAFAVLGCAIHQHEEALQGGRREMPANRHGPIRSANGRWSYVACCDLFSRNGWSGRGGRADQACIRPLSSTDNTAWSCFHLERCAMEGGVTIVQITQNGTREVAGCNFVMEKCLAVGTAGTLNGVVTQYTGLTFRNNIFIRPNTPSPGSSAWFSVFLRGYGADRMVLMNPDLPVECYNNTILNLLDDTNRAGAALSLDFPNEDLAFASFDVFSLENNAQATPNAPGQSRENPKLLALPFETVGGRWRSRYRGLRYQDHGTGVGDLLRMDTRFGTPDDTVSEPRPEPDSPLIDTAMGTVAIDDFWGRIRGQRPDRGAIET